MNTTIKTCITIESIEGKTFFVGDIHACYDKLIQKLSAVSFDYLTDRLIATGDLIDHGPDSEKCLMLLNEPWFYSVIGNHEIMVLDAVLHRKRNGERSMEQRLHTHNGGHWFYEISEAKQDELVDLIVTSMPVAYEVLIGDSTIGVVHAASRADWHKFKEEKDRMSMHLLAYYTWTRYEHPLPKKIQNIAAVVMGHQNDIEVVNMGNQLWIDTIKRTGELTMLSEVEVLERISSHTV